MIAPEILRAVQKEPPIAIQEISKGYQRQKTNLRRAPAPPAPKGGTRAVQRKAPDAELAMLKQRKNPWQRGLRIAPVFSKKRNTSMAQKICV